jgi:hypothetical protein
VVFNIINQVDVVNDKNMPGSAEAQPGTKAGGVVLFGGSIPPFAFNDVPEWLGVGSGGGFGGWQPPVGNEWGYSEISPTMEIPAFGENLPPLKGAGGVIKCAKRQRKTGKSLHYFNTLAKDVKILSFRLVVL